LAITGSQDLLQQANAVLAASKTLDYTKITKHDPPEVAKLMAVLSELNIEVEPSTAAPVSERVTSGNGAGADFKPAVHQPGGGDNPMANREEITAVLNKEGFSDRLAAVYNSLSPSRKTSFLQIPHRRGIPPFAVVVAPDFSPITGFHGIFISSSELMSITLAAENQTEAEWLVVKRKSFDGMEEMAEVLTLMAAGFDIP
jgi:hypothetical protein